MPGIAANLEDIRTDEQYRSAISKRRQEEEQPGTAYRQRVFPLGVDYQENTGFIFGRRTSRYFDIRQLDGIRVPAIRN